MAPSAFPGLQPPVVDEYPPEELDGEDTPPEPWGRSSVDFPVLKVTPLAFSFWKTARYSLPSLSRSRAIRTLLPANSDTSRYLASVDASLLPVTRSIFFSSFSFPCQLSCHENEAKLDPSSSIL